ncbi:DUF2865 domain-containing protein [Bradyrhizobium sp. AUGA SZCCT0177]|uniref:DUF2865 domain-containing protein n=1 Tax=Bradyrhizobium sp. AUGA SZCCT0177 TaxID=2807665 RepID=UPI001BAA4900|nr:DUF2865 domain-containing protein [Bradyrhizobium sp. AUGA SZCCT0177]MBR1287356.1 DUF2865 domain-containing protein [Bradyrhizobium sp. AUGA SZCCT0177]
MRRRATSIAAATLAASFMLVPGSVSAEGLFDMFFGGGQKQQARQAPAQANFFADPFGLNQPPAQPAPAPRVAGSGPAFCVRSCDGKYFPLTTRGNATPVQMCQAFCPASTTKVFYGSNIDSASASNGERYADSENAFAYRKALRADCTCNGRSPSGLAPVDLALDTSLRSGDVVATTDGLVAYTGVRLGAEQAAEFTPVASYPGLTASVRARLGEMKVAPVSAEMVGETVMPETRNEIAMPATVVPKSTAPKAAKRAEVN